MLLAKSGNARDYLVLVSIKVLEGEGDKLSNLDSILLVKAAACDSSGAYSDTAGYEGLLLIVRNCVLVNGNANLVKQVLCLLTRINLHTCKVNEHKVIIRTA